MSLSTLGLILMKYMPNYTEARTGNRELFLEGDQRAEFCCVCAQYQLRPDLPFDSLSPDTLGIQVNRNCLTMVITRVGKLISLFIDGHMCCLMQVGD